MTLKVDKVGRVILPKPIRDRMGLGPGRHVEFIETAVTPTAPNSFGSS